MTRFKIGDKVYENLEHLPEDKAHRTVGMIIEPGVEGDWLVEWANGKRTDCYEDFVQGKRKGEEYLIPA